MEKGKQCGGVDQVGARRSLIKGPLKHGCPNAACHGGLWSRCGMHAATSLSLGLSPLEADADWLLGHPVTPPPGHAGPAIKTEGERA